MANSARSTLITLGLLALVLAFRATAHAVPLAHTIDASGDSITRAFNANSCTYGDQVAFNFSTGDNHGTSYCSSGSDATFSHAERLECAKGGEIVNLNDAESGATMRGDFAAQSTTAKGNMLGNPAPRYVTVFLGHNDACTGTTSKTGNSCSGDQNPNNYCRTTTAAFEREFREGMDQLITVPSARILISALVRVSELCNFQSKNSCGLGFGLDCEFLWENLTTIFGANGVCRSMTEDCSNTRRIDMYDTIVSYNQVLEAVTAEYAAIPTGGTSATGAVKAADVGIRYVEGAFHYKFASNDLSCCDCFHPSAAGHVKIAEGLWSGFQCSASTPCCAPSGDPLTNATCSANDESTLYPGGFWSGASCGNGVVDPGEQCESGVCCNAGTCQFVTSGTVCRAGSSICDPAETCTGASATCPAPALAPPSTVCRGSAGVCDPQENCTGSSAVCPSDAKSTAVCRAAAGSCDVAESCDGGGSACPADQVQPSSVVCRGAAGVCDLAESCSGSSPTCPADAKSTAVCRASAGVCDVTETCDGVANTCPANGFVAASTVCRGTAGVCDVAESCTGASAACPADAKSTAVCRPSTGSCDPTETCDGSTDACPADTLATAGTVCRGAAGVCDLAETCDGSTPTCPADARSTAVCRAAVDVCDVAESCDGIGIICPPDAFKSSAVPCRAAAGICDVTETCTGTSAACPSDAKSTAVCRAAAGVCDLAESCDGGNDACPGDAFAAASVVCRAATDQCDAAEGCTGSDAACPTDLAQPDGTTCNDGAACTTPDTCVAGACVGIADICGDGTTQAGCGEQCDDGNLTSGDGCSSTCQVENTPGCGAAPAVGCRQPVEPGRAGLFLRNSDSPAKDQLQWKWNRGAVTPKSAFGNPALSTSYQLCIYDDGELIHSAPLPAAGVCAGRDCWKETGSGYKYGEKTGARGGVTRITLKAGVAPGQAKILVKGKGANLAYPSFPLDQPVAVQLRNSLGECWDAVFSAPATRNQTEQFKDASD